MWVSVDYLRKMEGVSRQTIGRWIREGRYEHVSTTAGGHYRVWIEQEEVVFLYARVSTHKQISSLEEQARILMEKFPYGTLIKDIGSGFNFERRGLRTILEHCFSGTACTIVATRADRITRTGYGLIKRLVELSGGEIRVLEESDDSKENFSTDSLISFITSYINSHYGKRAAQRRAAARHSQDTHLPGE